MSKITTVNQLSAKSNVIFALHYSGCQCEISVDSGDCDTQQLKKGSVLTGDRFSIRLLYSFMPMNIFMCTCTTPLNLF